MLADEKRGISIARFADLCGVHYTTLYNVFVHETESLSEYVQRRVNIGYDKWRSGRVTVMKRPDNTRYLVVGKDPAPVLRKHTGLQYTPDKGFTVVTGLRNRLDYSAHPLNFKPRGK